MTKLYRIKYKNDVLHDKLTAEEAADKLQDYADRFFSEKDDEFNPSFLEMEELTNGSME